MSLPDDVVGETIPASFGPVQTELTIHSYQREWTTASYKQNVVHVKAAGGGSTRRGGVVGTIQFSMTEDEWRRMNRQYAERRRSA